ncbi:MAG: Unknown protein [uncultured Sulfurovum sp.]|uniref:VWFA domain-containing protein n=1 Tax=uncultured Sulfurovum sp. TaxID=269237 RepID=A0A6S6RW08_9BACT|nr:MAG: Unknown protein [uncultured Sulfurovum sp.]
MTLLYPSLLVLLIPLILFFTQASKQIIIRVHLVILMLILLTLSRPVIKESLHTAEIEAKDIIIALDVSYSMHATDIAPTRYSFAKETIQALLHKNSTDNIMLIAFTSNPLLLSPPTTDHKLIEIALQSFNPKFILTKGTSLEKLFHKLKKIQTGHKSLILITDGGEEKHVDILSQQLEKANISLITLALGTQKGTTLKNTDNSLLKDKEGHLIISRINPLLERLTDRVNGIYLTASSTPESTADLLVNALEKQTDQTQSIQKNHNQYQELYQYPLLLALLLFLVVHTRLVKYLLILLTFLGLHLEASLLDEYHLQRAYQAYEVEDFNRSKQHLKDVDVPSLESQITLANSYYKLEAYKKSITLYKSIRSTSAPIKQQLYYNIANAYAKLGAYAKAKIYYTKSLRLGEDGDAVHNLKIVTRLKDKNAAALGIAHPKSQDASSTKSDSQTNKEETREEDKPSSGSSGAGKSADEEKKRKKEKENNQLIDHQTPQEYPLGSKVYELINKGYIRETQPW